jgi:hypothetical protein
LTQITVWSYTRAGGKTRQTWLETRTTAPHMVVNLQMRGATPQEIKGGAAK